MRTIRSIAQDHRWRVFYTAPRAEKKAEKLLERQNIHVFLPKVTRLRQWKNGKHKVIEPFFPSYIFAHVHEAERIRVLRTNGIVRCVSFDNKLAELTPEEIEQIKIMLKDPARVARMENPMPKIGENVMVIEGPFEGLRGEVLMHGTQAYIIVRVQAIRQALKVNVPAAWVRSVPATNAA